MRYCKICGEVINPLRIKALPNAVTCVQHSQTSTYKAITVVEGEKDHTWNDIKLVDDTTFENYSKERSN